MIIGDNLSSHLTISVALMCEEHDIQFCFLPSNSSHMTQPLDVAFFRPMKIAWRKIIQNWKKGPGRKKATIPKEEFPWLLKELTNQLDQNRVNNLKAGFKKCGIVPLNVQKVLDRLPKEKNLGNQANKAEEEAAVDDAFVQILKEMRYDSVPQIRKRKKINVSPGKSIKGADFESSEDQDERTDINVSKRKNSCVKQEVISLDEQPGCSFSGESNAQNPCTEFRQQSTKKLKSIPKYDMNLIEGDFVLFEYEGEIFPGQVALVKDTGCEIRAMKKSGLNWKWPKEENKLFYLNKDIKEKICPPKQLNRGVLQVPQLQWKW